MKKELHIWMGEDYPSDIKLHITLNSTEKALKEEQEIVHTTQPHACNTKWIIKGYRIFAHMLDGEDVEIVLGTTNKGTLKDIRVEHNIEKLLLANVFGLATE